MINLTSIRLLVEQQHGYLEAARAAMPLSVGVRDALDQSIAINRYISEEINNAVPQKIAISRTRAAPAD